jgi:hypothetical protein
MRLALALLITLSCAGCADILKPAAQAPASQQAPAPQQTVATANPPPVADAPPKFECSDGTISSSQEACLVAMARARLPASQTTDRTPASATGAGR